MARGPTVRVTDPNAAVVVIAAMIVPSGVAHRDRPHRHDDRQTAPPTKEGRIAWRLKPMRAMPGKTNADDYSCRFPDLAYP
jgi:hypothetical protein